MKRLNTEYHRLVLKILLSIFIIAKSFSDTSLFPKHSRFIYLSVSEQAGGDD